MLALKNSFLVSMSAMYLIFDSRKTRLETLWHTLSVCEVYCLWLYLEDGVLTLDQFSPRVERDRTLRATAGASVW